MCWLKPDFCALSAGEGELRRQITAGRSTFRKETNPDYNGKREILLADREP